MDRRNDRGQGWLTFAAAIGSSHSSQADDHIQWTELIMF